ncbi:MAG: bL35 family ribosomal protein [bacterium]|nr:bL35 family ribosomal protein [bacterium]
MSKQKTRKSVSKRFRVTRTGKVLHRVSFGRHLRASKSASQKRRYKSTAILTGVRALKIKRMLGLA